MGEHALKEQLLSSVLLEALKDALCFGCGVRFGDRSPQALKIARGCVTCRSPRQAIATAEESPACR